MLIICCCFVYKNKNDLINFYQRISTKSDPSQDDEKNDNDLDYLSDDMVTFEKHYDPVSDYEKHFGDVQDIVERGELVVCAKIDDYNVLFQMKVNDKRYIGADIDFAKQIAAALGVRLSYRMIYKTYDDVVDAIARGDGDIGIAKLSYTSERSKKILYTSSYAKFKKMVLINRIFFEKARKNTLRQLLNNRDVAVGVVKGSSYESFSQTMFPNATVIAEENWNDDIIQYLVKGKIMATMRDEIRIKSLLKLHPDLLIKLMPIIISDENDSIAAIVNPNSSQFLHWLDKFIETEKKVDTADSILKKYEDYVK
ncbi:MAG: transporter substrate-binding domain-containing protein [Holosporales bacterium]|nr:transporter substrate-binding domain-containing protein [Holosporales bacterium]